MLLKYVSKYAWVFLLKDKKSITITKALQNFLGKFRLKPNNTWVSKRIEFYG